MDLDLIDLTRPVILGIFLKFCNHLFCYLWSTHLHIVPNFLFWFFVDSDSGQCKCVMNFTNIALLLFLAFVVKLHINVLREFPCKTETCSLFNSFQLSFFTMWSSMLKTWALLMMTVFSNGNVDYQIMPHSKENYVLCQTECQRCYVDIFFFFLVSVGTCNIVIFLCS